MISFNKDAYGQTIRANFDRDISTATAFTMDLEPEVGDVQTVTPTLGTSNTDVGDETFSANEFVEYTTTSDQFTYTGRWRIKATALVGTEMYSTDYIFFRVTD